jgi:ABC-type antimicrobial peptide transport system permease subunit
MLRTSGDPKGVMAEVRRSVNRVSNRLPILEVTTLGRQIEQRMEQQKLVAILCTLFGVMALVLTSAGIYGTVSYSVSRRTSEIGIRMAVGAQWGRVLWMVLQDSLLLVAFGLGVGLPLGFLATRSIRNLLFGVGSTDPLALSASVFLILLLGSFAAFLPARRAAAMDPLTALRRE